MRSRSGAKQPPQPQIRRLAPPTRAAAPVPAPAQPSLDWGQPAGPTVASPAMGSAPGSAWAPPISGNPPVADAPGAPTGAPPTTSGRGGTDGIDRDTMLAGIGCVLMLFAGVVIAGLFALRMVKQDQPTTIPDPSQVAAVGATDATAGPTATAVFPSPTPRPTNTPFSTPWPTWTPLPENGTGSVRASDYRGHDSEYRRDIQEINNFMQASVKEVNSLLKDPQINDSMWSYKMNNQISVWTVMFQYMEASRPPTRYERFHANFVKAMARLDSAADDIVYAVDYEDASGFVSARSKIEQGTALLNEAMAGFKPTASLDHPSAAETRHPEL